jgi:hypothetical protein
MVAERIASIDTRRMDTVSGGVVSGLVVLLFLGAWAAPSRAQPIDYLFEGAVAPYEWNFSSFSISTLFTQGHRFEVTRERQLSEAGGFFTPREEGTFIEVFVAVVALDGPTDLPDSYDLHGSDVLDTNVLVVQAEGGDISASFDLTLMPGWYMIVLGFDDFGADSYTGLDLTGVTNGWTDGDPSQKIVSMRRDGSFEIEQDAPARIFAAPEPASLVVNVVALAALAAIARTPQRV